MLTIVGPVALAAWTVVPLLPERAQAALAGTIDTVPGTVEELFSQTGLGQFAESEPSRVSADVDEEYVISATIWP